MPIMPNETESRIVRDGKGFLHAPLPLWNPGRFADGSGRFAGTSSAAAATACARSAPASRAAATAQPATPVLLSKPRHGRAAFSVAAILRPTGWAGLLLRPAARADDGRISRRAHDARARGNQSAGEPPHAPARPLAARLRSAHGGLQSWRLRAAIPRLQR